MNGNNSTTAKAERLSDNKRLEFQWRTIDWKQAETYVNRLQIRIAKMATEKKWNTVKRLQYLLTHSYYAKALAVRKVTTNKGKKTAGVDKELWNTPLSKMKAVLSLTDKKLQSKTIKTCLYRKERQESKTSSRYSVYV